MLEVRNLTKVYKTKGGTDTHALDGVSVQFPEKGMVFLLGKSGSGKSTLLNVCGGLDSPTSGEIIVKGRSSKDFTQSDFDSYRNTFIGFIFQEYNILNEFSVEDNIALALELQGKPKNKQAISELLEKVDLTGYAKRKPNTLSGGQKQRIAIARALVKAPEIIMADEPTGALDSATGKQVFDTLKKLSQDKLVIVVSHDRDFAELYGDRVIELKDGKIISDVSKTQEEQKSLSTNVTAIGDTLCVKKGAKLSDKDFEEIRAFLKNSDSDIIIATGEKDVKTFKDVNRINDDGSKEVFRDTDESKMEKKSYRPEDSKFIRSKLPMRHAMKIGASGLKTKPFRLIFTVLLCTVAFVLFGLLSTMTFYDSSSTLKQTLKDSSISALKLGKEYQIQEMNYRGNELEHTWTGSRETRFNDEDVNEYVNTFGNDVFGAVKVNNASFSVQSTSEYYDNSFNSFAYLPENNSLRSKIIHGNYPTADGEICISSYTANTMKECKLFDQNGRALDINSIDQLIGKSLKINNTTYKIVGILDCGTLDSKFDIFKETENADEDAKKALKEKFAAELNDGLFKVVFVTKEGIEDIANRYSNYYGDDLFNYHYLFVATVYNDETNEYEFDTNNMWQNGSYAAISNYNKSNDAVFFDTNKTSLAQNEAFVSGYMFLERLYRPIQSELEFVRSQFELAKNSSSTYQDAMQDIRDAFYADDSEEKQNYDIWSALSVWENCEYSNQLYSNPNASSYIYSYYQDWKTALQNDVDLSEKHQKVQKIARLQQARERLSQGGYWDYELESHVELTSSERTAYADELLSNLNLIEMPAMTVKARLFNSQDQIAYGDDLVYSVVGVFGLTGQNYGNSQFLLNDDTANALWEDQRSHLDYYHITTSKYNAPANAIYDVLYLPYDHTDSATELFATIYANKAFNEDGSRVHLSSSILSGFQMADSMVEELSKVFLYVGLVMALFSALLLSNFISVSISHKKRDIGILRAVGARSLDVFKIFFSESFVITVICVILAMAGSFAVCNLLNAEIASTIGASLFVFGPLSMLILVGVALVTAVVATFLPVYNAAKKKPVDSIRAIV